MPLNLTKKNLLLVFDECLIFQSKVLMKALRECLTGDITIYCIVSNSIDERMRADLLRVAENLELELILVDEFQPWIPFHSQARAPIAYQKFLWEYFLPESAAKLLYLDIDVVPMRNFDELFDIDFNQAFAAVALDDRKSRQLERWENTANGGVNLFNVEVWKRENLTIRAIQFISESHSKSELYADLVLNKIYYGNWFRLDSRYNCPYSKTFGLRFLFGRFNTSLVHFMGPQKPWTTKLWFPYNRYIVNLYRRRNREILSL